MSASLSFSAPDGSLVTIPAYTGWVPDPANQVAIDTEARPFAASLGAANTNDDVVQYLGLIRSQGSGPSCTGQTGAAMVDGVRGSTYAAASAIGPWVDARFREGGGKELIVAGTYLFLVMESLVRRGIETRVPGEDTNEALWTRAIDERGLRGGPGLDAEMDASDHHVDPMNRYRIADTEHWLLDAVDVALHGQHGVGFGTDVGDVYKKFDWRAAATVDASFALGREAIGTRTGAGHAQRIAGKRTVNGRRLYLIQNSWSVGWGLYGWYWYEGAMRRFDGVSVPDGAIHLAGCAWVDESVIVSAISRDFQVLTKAA